VANFFFASSGNLTTKAGLTLTYAAAGQAHAVSSTSGTNTYSLTYDANGNMITGNLTYNYNAENQLVSVQNGGTTIASYTYDGDGNLVVTNSSGSLLFTSLTKPWGESRYQSAAPNTDYQVTGQRRDSSRGTHSLPSHLFKKTSHSLLTNFFFSSSSAPLW
jgi:YD repeat-containing protein